MAAHHLVGVFVGDLVPGLARTEHLSSPGAYLGQVGDYGTRKAQHHQLMDGPSRAITSSSSVVRARQLSVVRVLVTFVDLRRTAGTVTLALSEMSPEPPADWRGLSAYKISLCVFLEPGISFEVFCY